MLAPSSNMSFNAFRVWRARELVSGVVLSVSIQHKYLLVVNNHSEHKCNSLLCAVYYIWLITRSMTRGKLLLLWVGTLKKSFPDLLNSLLEIFRNKTNKCKFKKIFRPPFDKNLCQSNYISSNSYYFSGFIPICTQRLYLFSLFWSDSPNVYTVL